MADTAPRISVVIPTVARETLGRAVCSALQQSYPPVEVIVVLDLERLPAGLELPASGVRTILTGGGRGPSAARQLGVDAAVGDAIALLDDDDYWYPDKLDVQTRLLQAARRDGARAVVSAGVDVVDPAGVKLDVVPRRAIRDGEAISDYLFKRREIRWGEATMGSSALLIDRDLLRAVPFDEQQHLFEDWDWLLRVGREQRVRFLTAEGVHLAYCVQPRGTSLSRSISWSTCIAWADQHRKLLSAREYGDFLLGVGISRAVDAGTRVGALRIAVRAFRRGRPGPPAVVAAAAMLMLPRSAPNAVLRTRAMWQRARKRIQGALD